MGMTNQWLQYVEDFLAGKLASIETAAYLEGCIRSDPGSQETILRYLDEHADAEALVLAKRLRQFLGFDRLDT